MTHWPSHFAEEGTRVWAANRRVLSFDEWMDELERRPYMLTRDVSQYVRDMLEHAGWYNVSRGGLTFRRNRVWDLDFRGEVDPVLGQEHVMEEIGNSLDAFIAQGGADRMLFLHGPNGSSKTSLIASLAKGLEDYSATPEGVLYTFAWVFPAELRTHLSGFGPEEAAPREGASYAHLPIEEVAARIPLELRESPFFLIPRPERRALLDLLLSKAPAEESGRFRWTQYLVNGGLSHKSKLIYEALFNLYRGDAREVLRHVQVQRYYISRRYRSALVSVAAQGATDAAARQVSRDESLDALPAVLRHLSLIEAYGDLVDANNGLIEFSDLLNRPVEANRYLLSTVERGEVALPFSNVHLNVLFVGTSNERPFQELKGSRDFPSFKGRFRTIPVGYILDVDVEKSVYSRMTARMAGGHHLMPHLTEFAARWAVLTRLNPPDPEVYPDPLRALVARLTPGDKMRLYRGAPMGPAWNSAETAALTNYLPLLRREYNDTPAYEGRWGVSPREMREVLEECFQEARGRCVGPPLLFGELADLCKDKSMYLFLQLKSSGGFHDPDAFLAQVRREYLETVAAEIRETAGWPADAASEAVEAAARDALAILGAPPGAVPRDRDSAAQVLAGMETRGYCPRCMPQVFAYFLAARE